LYPDLPKAAPEYKSSATTPVVETPYKSVYDPSIQALSIVQPKASRPSTTLRVYRPELLAKKDTELRHPLNHAPFVIFTSGGSLKASGLSTRGETATILYKLTANEAVISKVRKSKTGDSSGEFYMIFHTA